MLLNMIKMRKSSMTDDDDCVQHYELKWVQEQIWELERKVEELEEEIKRLKEKKDDD